MMKVKTVSPLPQPLPREGGGEIRESLATFIVAIVLEAITADALAKGAEYRPQQLRALTIPTIPARWRMVTPRWQLARLQLRLRKHILRFGTRTSRQTIRLLPGRPPRAAGVCKSNRSGASKE